VKGSKLAKVLVIVPLTIFAGFIGGLFVHYAFLIAESHSIYFPLGRWERLRVAPPPFVQLVGYHNGNLFIKAADGNLYSCGTGSDACFQTDVESEKKTRFCGEPGSLTPFAPGKIVNVLAVRICYPDAHSDIHFIVLNNGSIWTWKRWWSGNEQSLILARFGFFGALTGAIGAVIFVRRRLR
jgi:hypothetical protein